MIRDKLINTTRLTQNAKCINDKRINDNYLALSIFIGDGGGAGDPNNVSLNNYVIGLSFH